MVEGRNKAVQNNKKLADPEGSVLTILPSKFPIKRSDPTSSRHDGDDASHADEVKMDDGSSSYNPYLSAAMNEELSSSSSTPAPRIAGKQTSALTFKPRGILKKSSN
jgi:hypothetical protein